MRQCIFVIADPVQLAEIAPVLRLAGRSRLRHSIWYAGEQGQSFDLLKSELGASSSFVETGGFPGYYHCFRYVGGVKMWTTKGPLVVVQGNHLTSWLAALSGRWGGGEVVHMQSSAVSGDAEVTIARKFLRRRIHGIARYAICPDAESANRMRRYSGCIVVNTGESGEHAQAAVDVLLRWTGGGELRPDD